MAEPQTEAGRARHAAYHREKGERPSTCDYDCAERDAILAIEAQARHAALADVRRGVEAESEVFEFAGRTGKNQAEVELFAHSVAALRRVLAILDAAETP